MTVKEFIKFANTSYDKLSFYDTMEEMPILWDESEGWIFDTDVGYYHITTIGKESNMLDVEVDSVAWTPTGFMVFIELEDGVDYDSHEDEEDSEPVQMSDGLAEVLGLVMAWADSYIENAKRMGDM